MNREDILNKSRAENKGADERELQVNAKAGNIAFRCGAALCMILILIESLLCDTRGLMPPLFAVYLFMAACGEIYAGIALKSKRVILGVFYALLCVAFLVFFILDCLGTK